MRKKIIKWSAIFLTCFAAIAAIYYFGVAKLPQQTMTQAEIVDKYQYFNTFSNFKVLSEVGNSRSFSFRAFDGELIHGQIQLPEQKRDSYPVLVGLHAMGRSYPRWFKDELKGRPTVTKVDKLTKMALSKGYAVVAIDARFHGKRKIEGKSLRRIWNNLHYFGDKFDYQQMIVNTVTDNRTLLDWIATQPELDANRITLAGYSMGGQVALLMGAVDNRVKQIISVVPPFMDNKVAIVSPLNLVSKINAARVLVIYGEHDDVASPEQNQLIFDNITSTHKQIVSFAEDHILPIEYVEVVGNWLKIE